jgi:hypothetical protein
MRDRLTRPFRPGGLLATAAALAAATTIAACGSSSPPTSSAPSGSSASTGSGSNSARARLAFSECMRADGVPDFPDLGSNGMLIEASGQTISVNGVSVNAPAYVAARAKCQRYLPASTASGPQQAQQLARTLDFSRCMRSHGVPNFPDPKVTAGTNGNRVADLRGAGLNFSSPAFQAAAKACGGGPKGP